jgi:hypothetical protein
MSSWYVWSALGGYPETPGAAELALGSPEFTRIAIRLADGKTIAESAPAAADDAPYVQTMTLNGTPWPKTYLPASIFTDGATLSWTLGAAPGPTWGTGADDAPPSNTAGLLDALGYLADADNGVVVTSGAGATLTVGVQSLSPVSQTITWTASAPSGSGITMTAAAGTITVSSEAKATQTVDVRVPPGTPDGQYMVTFTLKTAAGTALPEVVAEVDVT